MEKELIKKHNLSFTNHKTGADQLMSFRSFVYAQRFLIFDFTCYYYRTHGLSATSGNKDERYLKDHSEIASEMLKVIEQENLWDYFGFMKRLFIILFRLNLYSVKNSNLKSHLFKSYRKQMKEVIKKSKVSRTRGVRFRLQVERFYLFPPVFWRTFKM